MTDQVLGVSWPLLFGQQEDIEGYYQLERLERQFAHSTLLKHRTPVSAWYRLLALHQRALLRNFSFEGSEPSDEWRTWKRRQELLGLGISLSKAALDMLLIGYYSVAYAAIRHMIETALQCRYLEEFPEKARKANLPSFDKLVKDLKTKIPAEADVFERAHEAWLLMSKGAHPSQEGLWQTYDEAAGRYVLGPNYDEELCVVGLEHGLSAATRLLTQIDRLEPQEQGWRRELAATFNTFSRWRSEVHKKYAHLL